MERILEELLEEEQEQRFSAQNISIYLAMQLATRCIADMPWKSGQRIRKRSMTGLECDSESSFGYEQDGFFGRIRTRS
ncbi:MAG: hypothetical protein ACLRMN_09620 [Mediterraneibacter gnavus]